MNKYTGHGLAAAYGDAGVRDVGAREDMMEALRVREVEAAAHRRNLRQRAPAGVPRRGGYHAT
jgi:hypothetical protein